MTSCTIPNRAHSGASMGEWVWAIAVDAGDVHRLLSESGIYFATAELSATSNTCATGPRICCAARACRQHVHLDLGNPGSPSPKYLFRWQASPSTLAGLR